MGSKEIGYYLKEEVFMDNWKCIMRGEGEDAVFSASDENLKAILATMAERKSKKVGKGILL